jgi:hypothetical protein
VQEIFTPQVLAPGATANYPTDFIRPGEEDNYIAYSISNQGRLPERRVEGGEINVPTFKVGNSIDWDIEYMEQARWDIVKRAIHVYEAGYVRKISSDGWRTLLMAGSDRGLVVTASGAAVLTGSTACATLPPNQGEFTKELVSRMMTAMTRGAGGNGNAGRLTDLYLSLEAMECVRAWDLSRVDDFTRRQIFTSPEAGLTSIYGVLLHPMTEFGVGQEYQAFLTDVLSLALPANTAEFVVGLDQSTQDSFVMPIRREITTHWDEALRRQLRAGVFGHGSWGFGVLDNRRTILGAF